MNVHLPPRLTVDDFLRWSQEQERGRYELEGGLIISMPSENIGHIDTKALAYHALLSAIGRAGVPFYAMPDGPTVRIPGDRAYEPDALVAPLPKPPRSALEVPDPVVVIEVLSPTPSSMRRDLTTKLVGYALVPSIQHYVVIDPEARVVFRYRRLGELLVPAEELTEGTLRLDPPGLEVPVADMLLPPDDSKSAAT